MQCCSSQVLASNCREKRNMELTDDGAVRAFLRGPMRTRVPGPLPRQRSGRAPARCRCGSCARCVDDAKWERVFNEKFADPDYYKARPVPQGSSLGWLKR